ncbi:unnamed protein product [Acanthoscelides obtectus]|uniref:Uncharacterized protein n=1 Tax=Acanthoscelides obtectus TaxID=200917 RepID=A0A9P0MK28_ACAOB|nr:unnamed protein product [Acanthoscelides obtectus]CAK1631793.1 hypothetical protein AOBTE_LOCUS7165 [Acanthoscelides obtectus]
MTIHQPFWNQPTLLTSPKMLYAVTVWEKCRLWIQI